MSDDAKPEREKPARRSRFAEGVDAASEGAVTLSRLSPQQALTLVAIMALGFICSLQAYQVWSYQENQKLDRHEREARSGDAMRENNAQAELARQNCAAEGKALRDYFADRDERRMRFEAEEQAKNRAALAMVAAEVAELRRAVKKGE